MNRQRGMSSLALILLLLILGSLMLDGLNQQLSSHIKRVSLESEGIQRQADVHSAMEWGRQQTWLPQPAQQCLQHAGHDWQVCLRIFPDSSAVLTAVSQQAQLWRLAKVENGTVRFLPRGWSDFCPMKESALCQIP